MFRKHARTRLIALLTAVLLFLGPAVSAPAHARTALADGTYLVDVVLEGGSGRASVDSPATVTVSGGAATATITWSSPHYDYMIVAGTTYHPTNTEGNSTFEIPVPVFDEPYDVIGDTTAMSRPHEIDYRLTFDSASARPVGDGAQDTPGAHLLVGLAVAVACGCLLLVPRRRVAR